MIKGVISSYTPCLVLGFDDNDQCYRPFIKENENVVSFISSETTPPNFKELLAYPHSLGNYEYKVGNIGLQKIGDEPENENKIKYNLFRSSNEKVKLTTSEYNVPGDLLFAGIKYDTEITLSVYSVNDPKMKPFGGKSDTVLMRKLKITFIPYSLAVAKYNEGVCSIVESRSELYNNYIKMLKGDLHTGFCQQRSIKSKNCYTTNPLCNFITYCPKNKTCSSECFGKTAKEKEQCMIFYDKRGKTSSRIYKKRPKKELGEFHMVNLPEDTHHSEIPLKPIKKVVKVEEDLITIRNLAIFFIVMSMIAIIGIKIILKS